MNASTIARFLFGNANAIREIGSNRSSLWTAIVLVLLTGIARNYDQNYFSESPFWLVGPLIFSFFSGSFLNLILIGGFARRRFEQTAGPQWPVFMALFWMTAPVAWLYAIPVERFMDSYGAAQANLALLGIVSAWRVLLMSRIMAVTLEIPFLRAFGWVMVAASLEVIIVVFLGAFFSGTFSRSILAGMAGMRHAPEEALVTSVLGNIWTYSWVVLLVTGAILAVFRYRGFTKPLPNPMPGRVPWVFLVVVAVLWIGIAVPSQMEQKRFIDHAALMNQEDYAGALTYLSRHEQSDFPAARRLEPSPYEYRVWEDLPPTISLLTSNSPPWVRNLYLSYLTTTLSHYHLRYDLTNSVGMFLAIEHLPEGREWLLSNQVALGGKVKEFRASGTNTEIEVTARSNLVQTLRRMGMAETNLNKIEE